MTPPVKVGPAVQSVSGEEGLAEMPLDALCVHTIRTLAMDAVQKAVSGHPGAPMALAPLAYVLWTRFLRHNPRNPDWFDRDRFVLSCGHASMLLYAVLHLTGYDLPLEEIVRFRQWGSRTPGHPEFGLTPGVETTTGPLGQGFMNAVGMAMAEAHLAARFNRPGNEVVDHRTFVLLSDGDLMEGASHEAASLAGHLGLGKLVGVFDDNRITIDGSTDLVCSDDVEARFAAYGWHVVNLGDKAEDIGALSRALESAVSETDRPSLVIVRSRIGFGSPTFEGKSKAHGEALGEEEVKRTKAAYGWPEDARFLIPGRALAHMRQAAERGVALERSWQDKMEAYRRDHPAEAASFEALLSGKLPAGWDAGLPVFKPEEGPLATRVASGKALNALAPRIPALVGGSADLASSNNSLIQGSGDLRRGRHGERNIRWGVREHLMCGACNGMALHGGVRPYAATFFIFTDYGRPSIRLAALMGLPVIYILTHDSIGLGEDGPTHQPVEHLASLRAMPGLCVIRPADANETVAAWKAAVQRTGGPTMIVLTRQAVPVLDRSRVAAADGLLRGAYVLSRERGRKPDLVLIGTGSEIPLVLDAQGALAREGVDARVVSMPSWELFREQPRAYREEVLPPAAKLRLAVEAGAAFGWREWVGDAGEVMGMNRFGASAPAKENFRRFGFTVENVVERAKRLLGR
jgi:transketolase